MTLRSLILVVTVLQASGCPSTSTPPGSSPDRRGTAEQAGGTGGAPPRGGSAKPTSQPAPVDVCRKIIQEFQAVVARRGACQRDLECVCYQGGFGDCGGVIDRRNAKKLDTLVHLARLSKCGHDRACAPRACIPTCVGGRCVHSARVTR